MNLQRRYIYGGVQRILHWWIAISVVLMAITGLIGSNLERGGLRSYVWSAHMYLGGIFVTGLVGRLVWGILGPKHAKFSSLYFPSEWFASLRSAKLMSADGAFGHHPQAAAGYIVCYALMVVLSTTGYLLAGILHGEGPWATALLDEFKHLRFIKTVHEYSWWILGGFVVSHVGALIFHEWKDKIPLAQSMFSGFQYRITKKEGSRHDDH